MVGRCRWDVLTDTVFRIRRSDVTDELRRSLCQVDPTISQGCTIKLQYFVLLENIFRLKASLTGVASGSVTLIV